MVLVAVLLAGKLAASKPLSHGMKRLDVWGKMLLFDSPSRLPKFDLLKCYSPRSKKAQLRQLPEPSSLSESTELNLGVMPVLALVRSLETALLQLSLLEHQL